MKNICFVNTTPFWGGGEKWHYENATQMVKRGFNVFFIANRNGEIKKRLRNTKITLLEENISNLSLLNPFLKKRISDFILANKIDCIIVNDSRDLKVISHVSRDCNISKLIYRRGIALPPKLNKLNEKIYYNMVTDIIFNSEETKRQFFTNLDRSKVKADLHTIYNGLEIKEYVSNKKKSKKVIIGNASRLTKQKGLEFLIELANKLKSNSINAEIRIAGAGEQEKFLKDEIEKLGIQSQIKLVGFYEDIHTFLSELDIYVCSSRYEGFGFSIAEAMLHRLPIIGFDISSNPELIIDKENGYLVPPFDTDMLYNRTLELIRNEDIRVAFGNAGFKVVAEKFDREISFAQLENTFLSI